MVGLVDSADSARSVLVAEEMAAEPSVAEDVAPT